MSANENVVFVPQNGGLGATLSCTTVSSRVALPSPTQGDTFCVNNMGTDYVSLAFGNSSITATLSYLAFAPGLSYIGIANAAGSGAPTHMAGITSTGTITVQVTAGTLRGAP